MSRDGKDRRSRLGGLDLKGHVDQTLKQLRPHVASFDPVDTVELILTAKESLDLRSLIPLTPPDQGARLQLRLLHEIQDVLRPSESERFEFVQGLSRRWADQWKLFDPRLGQALRTMAARKDMALRAMKEQALQAAVFLALHDAQQPQVTRVGREKVMRVGGRLVLLQEKDLRRLAVEGLTHELVGKLSRRAVRARASFPFSLADLEGVFSRDDLQNVRPIDLGASLFCRWVRRRAIKHAEEWLLREAGFEIDKPHKDWTRVEVIQATDDLEVARPGVRELDVLEVLDQAEPDPLLWLFGRERLAEVLEVATRAQAETARLLWLYHLEQGWPVADAVKQIAHDRGVSVNTVHQTLGRLRVRVEERLSGFGDLRR